MALLRLQNKVPEIYVKDSRDFQLFCRLYDIIFNGLKYDIDGVTHIINTSTCKSTMLQLLQTKLGFFSQKDFTDTALRYILNCFPLLIHKKGTREALEELMYVFLKINGLQTIIKVDIIENKPTPEQTLLFNTQLNDHCIAIGVDSEIKDTKAMREILKYIVPFGYSVFFYFFVGEEQVDEYDYCDTIQLIALSNDVNDLAGSKSKIVQTTSGTYKHWSGPTSVTVKTAVTSSTTFQTTTEFMTESSTWAGILSHTITVEGEQVTEAFEIRKIKCIEPAVGATPAVYEITLDRAATFTQSEVLTYNQNWYDYGVEHDIASINTISAHDNDTGMATEYLSDIVNVSDEGED